MNDTQIIEDRRVELIFNCDGIYKETTDSVYKVWAKILTKQYSDGKQYYDIYFKSKFYSDTDNKFSNKELIEQYKNMCPLHVDDVIVYKNRLTTAMIDYLCMDDETLCKETSSISPQHCRINIMKSLGEFYKSF
jgi:hypothetical protein